MLLRTEFVLQDYLQPVFSSDLERSLVPNNIYNNQGLFSVRYLHGLVSKVDHASEREMQALLPSVQACYECAQLTGVKTKEPTTLSSLLYHLINKFAKRVSTQYCLNLFSASHDYIRLP